MSLERFRQGLQQLRHRALTTLPKSNGNRKGLPAMRNDLARQRDVAMPGGAELPVHLEVVRQILPTVAGSDIPNRSPGKAFAAAHDQMHPLALGVEQVVAAGFRAPTGVARALARNVRGQQGVETQLAAQ